MQHEFSLKQSEEKANQDKKDLLQQEELKKQRIIRNASISGVLALAVFIIILFRRITEKKEKQPRAFRSKRNSAGGYGEPENYSLPT